MSVAGQVVEISYYEQVSEDIMRILLRYRRAGAGHGHDDGRLHPCFSTQLGQIRRLVADGTSIVCSLPAFPCKSPNRQKSLGHLPDLGERASLLFLQRLCDQITTVYQPGAQVLICSDGHVFGDLIRVPDPDISAYADALREMVNEEGITCIDFFSLTNVYGDLPFDDKRARLTDEFAESLDRLREEVRTDDAALHLYRGITRFLLEDAQGIYPGTKSALQRDCRKRSYGVIQRSRAWSSLIRKYHPKSLRLSIHPQPCGSSKFGIALLESANSWVTPWHSVAVQNADGELTLMKRSEAEKIGRLQFINGLPSHYVVNISAAGPAGGSHPEVNWSARA